MSSLMLFGRDYARSRGFDKWLCFDLYFYFVYNLFANPIAAHPPIEYPWTNSIYRPRPVKQLYTFTASVWDFVIEGEPVDCPYPLQFHKIT